jgi:membrane-associated phospholipid phosphatase
VAVRQLDQRDHWASDIVFGAALGWTIGHSVAGKKDLPEIAGFKIVPSLIGRQAAPGISLLKSF